jgi:hypothetical protein
MRFPWTRILDAIAAAFSRTPDPDGALPPSARAELERWDADDIEYYRGTGGGIAGADAPRIPDDGKI